MALPTYTAPPPGSAVSSNPPATYFDKMVTSNASLAARDVYNDEAITAQQSAVANEATARAAADTALSTSITNETSWRMAADANETSWRMAADTNETSWRMAADAALAASITAVAAWTSIGRPGDVPEAFGIGSDGEGDIDPATIVVTAEGKAIRLAGEVMLATRAIYPLERGEIYRIDHRLWRSTNSDDEANDAVTVGMRWFDKDAAFLSSSVLDTYTTLFVGPVESRPHYTSRVAGPQVDIPPPTNARGFRIYVQARGTTPRTDVSLLRMTRITGGTASLDLGTVEARVDALEAIRPVSSTATVLDDDVLIIEPPSTFGVLRIVGEHASRQVWADVMFTTSANAAGAGMVLMVRGTGVTVLATGSHLTDGVGADTKVTIACDFSGAIRISNRIGAALRLAWTFSPVGL